MQTIGIDEYILRITCTVVVARAKVFPGIVVVSVTGHSLCPSEVLCSRPQATLHAFALVSFRLHNNAERTATLRGPAVRKPDTGSYSQTTAALVILAATSTRGQRQASGTVRTLCTSFLCCPEPQTQHKESVWWAYLLRTCWRPIASLHRVCFQSGSACTRHP
jgi:hypothetical protein